MKPLVYKGLRKNLNRSEWVSSDEIKQESEEAYIREAKHLTNGRGVIMKPPCRGCQFREVGCHSKCESYIQWRALLDKYNEQRNIQGDAYKYVGDNVRTIRHRMRKLKGYSCTVRD